MANRFFQNKRINQTIKATLDELVSKYGNIKYAYAIMSKRNPLDMVIISNHTVWFDLYLQNSYQLIDPVIIKSLDRVQDFSWDEKVMIASEISLPKIFNAAKQYDIKMGHTFVLHDHKNNLVVFSIFSGAESDENFKECVTGNEEKLQFLLIKIHGKMLSLYHELDYSPQNNSTPIISPRENTVLYWSSQGKTSQEIAIILGIKQSTVKFHIKNIIRKLGVSNSKHAIKLAVELQLISPAPAS